MTELARIRDSDTTLPDVIRPVASAAALLETFQAYQSLERALLVTDDYQQIEGKTRKKKSAWRKLATAMGVSLETKEKAWERDEQGRIVSAEVTAVAIAPNGRFSDGWGGAHVTERCCPRDCRRNARNARHRHCPAATGFHTDPWSHWTQPYHDLRALAETRAKNRAASDLFGFGEVSAEEINEGDAGEEASPHTAVRLGWRNLDEQNAAHQRLNVFLANEGMGEWVAMWLDSKGYTRPLSRRQMDELRVAVTSELEDRKQEASQAPEAGTPRPASGPTAGPGVTQAPPGETGPATTSPPSPRPGGAAASPGGDTDASVTGPGPAQEPPNTEAATSPPPASPGDGDAHRSGKGVRSGTTGKRATAPAPAGPQTDDAEQAEFEQQLAAADEDARKWTR